MSALLGGQVGQNAEHALGVLACENRPVQDLGVVFGEAHGDGLHGGGGSGHGHQGCRVVHGHAVLHLVQHGGDSHLEPFQLVVGRRIGVHVALGEANAADLGGNDSGGLAVADGELRAPAAYVEHEERRRPGQPPGRAEERQPGLFLPRQDLHGFPRQAENGPGQLVTIGSVANGAGRGEVDALRAQGSGPSAVALQHHQRAPERVRGDLPSLVDAPADPGDHHVAGQLLQLRLTLGKSGHQEPDGVRPEVDRRDPPSRLLVMKRSVFGQPAGHPRSYGIGPSRQVVGVMRVQTLDPSGGASHASPRLRPRVKAVPFVRVLLVRPPERDAEVRFDLGSLREPLDPTVGLEARHGADRHGTSQPVQGGERIAFGIDRAVSDHQRMPRAASSHHREWNRWLPPELGGHGRAIRSAGYFRPISARAATQGRANTRRLA